jgi:hypothetical protein
MSADAGALPEGWEAVKSSRCVRLSNCARGKPRRRASLARATAARTWADRRVVWAFARARRACNASRRARRSAYRPCSSHQRVTRARARRPTHAAVLRRSPPAARHPPRQRRPGHEPRRGGQPLTRFSLLAAATPTTRMRTRAKRRGIGPQPQSPRRSRFPLGGRSRRRAAQVKRTTSTPVSAPGEAAARLSLT